MIELPVYLAFYEPLKFTKDPLLKQFVDFVSIPNLFPDFKRLVDSYNTNKPTDFLIKAIAYLKNPNFNPLLWRQIEALNRHYKTTNEELYIRKIEEYNNQLIELPELPQVDTPTPETNFKHRMAAFQLLLVDMLAKLQTPIIEESIDSESDLISKPDELSDTSSQELSQSDSLDSNSHQLNYARQLLGDYLTELKNEKKSWTYRIKFFHQTRKDNKIAYCEEMLVSLQAESDAPVHERIKAAHAIAAIGKKELDEGGSYIGTSRLLGIQRLLGINEAWTKGRSSFFGIQTGSDFHGLKAIGVVGNDCQKQIEKFYAAEDETTIEGIEIARVVRG